MWDEAEIYAIVLENNKQLTGVNPPLGQQLAKGQDPLNN
jgi:hypothetical protein